MDANLKIGSIVKVSETGKELYLVYGLTINSMTAAFIDDAKSYAEVLPVLSGWGKKITEWCLSHKRYSGKAPWERSEIESSLLKWKYRKLNSVVVVGHVDDLHKHLVATGAVEEDKPTPIPSTRFGAGAYGE